MKNNRVTAHLVRDRIFSALISRIEKYNLRVSEPINTDHVKLCFPRCVDEFGNDVDSESGFDSDHGLCESGELSTNGCAFIEKIISSDEK